MENFSELRLILFKSHSIKQNLLYKSYFKFLLKTLKTLNIIFKRNLEYNHV